MVKLNHQHIHQHHIQPTHHHHKNATKRKRLNFFTQSVTQQQHWTIIDGKKVNTANDVERHPSWNEALIDLAIVASFSALDDFIDDVVKEHSSINILYSIYIYFICYYPLFDIWQAIDGHVNRFGTDGSSGVFVILYALIAISIANTALKGLKEDLHVAFQNFILSLVLLNIGMMLMYGRILLYKLKSAMFFATNQFIFHSSIACLWFMLWLCSGNIYVLHCGWIMLIVLSIYRIDTILYLAKNFTPYYFPSYEVIVVPMHVTLGAERLGLLVLLATGECVMGTISTVTTFSLNTVLAILLAASQGYLFKLAYFDIFDCTGEHSEIHALRLSPESGIRSMLFHMPLTMGMTLSSGLIVNVFKSVDDVITLTLIQRALYCLSFSMVLYSIWRIRSCHVYEESSTINFENKLINTIVFGTTFLLPFAPIAKPLILQCILLLLFSVAVFGGPLLELYQHNSHYEEAQITVADSDPDTSLALIESNLKSSYHGKAEEKLSLISSDTKSEALFQVYGTSTADK